MLEAVIFKIDDKVTLCTNPLSGLGYKLEPKSYGIVDSKMNDGLKFRWTLNNNYDNSNNNYNNNNNITNNDNMNRRDTEKQHHTERAHMVRSYVYNIRT